jgi:hypothetical protein
VTSVACGLICEPFRLSRGNVGLGKGFFAGVTIDAEAGCLFIVKFRQENAFCQMWAATMAHAVFRGRFVGPN